MATFVLIHGAGDAGWYWHLTEAELQARGHHTIAPDLPCNNHMASLNDYVRTVTDAAAGRQDLVIVCQSYGAFVLGIEPGPGSAGFGRILLRPHRGASSAGPRMTQPPP